MGDKRIRRSVSMRDGEYIALKLYTEHVDEANAGDFTMTGVLKMVLFGELPPIPQKYLDMGRREAKIEREERARNPQSTSASKTKEKEEQEFRSGGNIFTF